MTISVSRRAVLKGTGAGFAASLFMHTAPTLAAETQAHSGGQRMDRLYDLRQLQSHADVRHHFSCQRQYGDPH